MTGTMREARVPPQDLSAERAALSAMLQGTATSREAIAKAVADLKTDDFYRGAHQEIYGAIRGLFESGEAIDSITVCDRLRRDGTLESAGGPAYVAGLIDEVSIATNIEEYVKIVRAKATLRRLMDVGHVLFGKAAENREEPDELLNAMSQRLYDIAQERLQFGLMPMKGTLLSEVEKVEALASRAATEGAMLTGLPTGYHWLDQLTSGLQKGEMVVLAARPGMGKTSFALNIAENVAAQRKVPVLIFSLEMSAHSLVRRMICAHAKVNSHDVRRGRLYAEDRSRILNGAAVLHDLPIWIDESSRLTPMQVRARARRVLGETGAFDGLIIIDYLQMMDAVAEDDGGRYESRQQEITSISRGIKAVAKDLNVPVLVLSQLSRAPERRDTGAKTQGGSKPRLSDLRESGAIEQDADVVMFIYRDPIDAQEGEGTAEHQGYVARVSVAKQRNGPTGTFRLYFHRSYTAFGPLSDSGFMPDDENLLPEDE